MKKARPRPPPPPAPPDSAEEPFWNVNWKHFPPRLPERGRGRGSAPPLPTGESSGVPSKLLLPARDGDEGERREKTKRRSNGGHRESPNRGGLGWGSRLPARARNRGTGSKRGMNPPDCPHHVTFEGGLCGRAALKAGPQTPACPPATPTPYRGLPQKGPWSSSDVF